MGVPGKNSVLLILDANTGADLQYSGDGHTTGFVGDGTANDIEVSSKIGLQTQKYIFLGCF